MASNMLWLETLKKTVENSIKSDLDRLVVVIHYVLLKHNFKCVGVGDSKTLTGDEKHSELLPDTWNNNQEAYYLRYVKDDLLYILSITKTGDDILSSLISASDLKVNSVIVANCDVADLKEEKIVKKIEDEFFTAAAPKAKATTTIPSIRPDAGGVFIPVLPPSSIQPRFPEFGRSDLDPFAPGPPTGMIFPSPFGPNQRPRLRIDPINPLPLPGGNRREFPDPDEFMPPGNNFYM